MLEYSTMYNNITFINAADGWHRKPA